MIFKPKYSYEYNCILNSDFNENEQIKNYASLLTDKDRFFLLLNDINNEETSSLLEKYSGITFPQEIYFYVVRAEKFDSFSEPITIEYQINPERMIINLVKETIKTFIDIRFPDEEIRDEYINKFLKFIFSKFKNKNYLKFLENIENDIDFEKNNLKEIIYTLYE